MSSYAHDFPYGAQLLDDQMTRFQIWAPDMEQLTLEIDGQAPVAMERHSDGLHQYTASVGAGAAYQYRISPDLAVPDPASRMQQDDVNGPSIVVDPTAYQWQQDDWLGRPWHEIVVYEMHPGCYGGFAAMERQLAYLAEIGITAIELMPIADFSGARNWGYDGVLPYAPDRAYGTPEQLKHLIDSAHRHGLCVYLDVVYNHFGPEGNYLHSYASSFFSEENPSPWGPSIDFNQKHVREFFIHNAIYWLKEYRFDGLRFDAVHAISDPDWLDEMASRIRAVSEPHRHIHLMLENERNSSSHLERDFDAQWNDDIHNVVHVLLTGEHEGYYGNYQDEPTQKLARALAEGFVYQGEPAPARGNRPRGTPSGHLPPKRFVFFLQNHDQIGNRALGERLVSLADRDALKAAVTLQLLCPQIPLLFMGEERGLESPFLFFTDFHGELAEAVRKGRRAEFSAFSHFSDAKAQQQIPDPNVPETFERSARGVADTDQLSDDQREWQAFYRELLKLRHNSIIPHLAEATNLGATVLGEACVMARWQLGPDKVLSMVVNFSSEDQEISQAAGDLLPGGEHVFESRPGAADQVRAGRAVARATSVFISRSNEGESTQGTSPQRIINGDRV